jgi:hypothetical protein
MRNRTGILLFVGVLAVPGLYLFGTSGLNLLFNGDTRYFYQYRDPTSRVGKVDLVPGFVQLGTSKEEVETRLLRAGFEAWSTMYPQVPKGANSTLKFRLFAGAQDIFCSSELYLSLAFDNRDMLHSGYVEQGGACL